MLARVLVRDGRHLLARVADDHLAVVAPGCTGGVTRGRRQRVDQRRNTSHHVFGQGTRGGEQPRRALVAMLGLADQVAGDDGSVSRVVGDHRDLGGPGEDVDADLAEQRALGLGDEFVARADDHVGRLAGEQALGHRRDRLHAAERHDHVGARLVEGVEQVRVHRTAAKWPRAGDDRLHAGGLGGGHAHVGRGDVRVAARWGITACHVDRQHALSGSYTLVHLDRELLQRLALGVRERADLRDREVDVALDLRGHLGGAAIDLGAGQHDLAVPAVELLGVGAHRGLAVAADLGQHLGHHLLRSGGLGFRRLRRLLQVGHAHRRTPGLENVFSAAPKEAARGRLACRRQFDLLANSRSLASEATRFM